MARKQGSPIEEAGRKELGKKVDDRFTKPMDGFREKQTRDTEKWMKEHTKR